MFAQAPATGFAESAARPALRLFFAEGDADMLVDLVTEGASTFEILAGLSRTLLPPGHPTTLFLSEPPP